MPSSRGGTGNPPVRQQVVDVRGRVMANAGE